MQYSMFSESTIDVAMKLKIHVHTDFYLWGAKNCTWDFGTSQLTLHLTLFNFKEFLNQLPPPFLRQTFDIRTFDWQFLLQRLTGSAQVVVGRCSRRKLDALVMMVAQPSSNYCPLWNSDVFSKMDSMAYYRWATVPWHYFYTCIYIPYSSV